MRSAVSAIGGRDDSADMQHSLAHAHVQETVQLHERVGRVDVIDGSRRCSVDDADEARRHLKRGRKPHKIWIHFGKLPNSSGKTHPDSACLHCGEVIYNGKPSDNLKRHLLEHCDKITELNRMDVEKLFSKKQRVGDANPVEAGQAVQSQAVVLPRAPPFASQEAFEHSYARHTYGHNLSWNLVNDAGYRKFYERMVPDFRLPTRQKLATSLLDAVYEEVMERAIKSIKKRKVVIRVTDSSTNPDRASAVNFVVVAPAMKPLLWASHVTGDERHTAVTLNSKLEAVIDDIEAKTQATVVGVLTDDTDNENKSWEILEDRPIFGGGCAAHALSLLIDDVLKYPQVVVLVEKALLPMQIVRSSHATEHIVNEQIEEVNGPHQPQHGLSVPCAAGWYTTVRALKNARSNEATLQRLFVGPMKDDTVRRYSVNAKTL